MGVAVEIIQYEYECLGGPLDGQRRSFGAEKPSGAPRWFVSMRLSIASGEVFLTESIGKPEAHVWTVMGFYELRADDNKRRGRRIRWKWFSFAAWPTGVSTLAPRDLMRNPPFQPPPPKTDFTNDDDTD